VSYSPQYSEAAIRLINACQAVAKVPRVDVVIDLEGAAKIKNILDEGEA